MAGMVDTQVVKNYLLGLQDRITVATSALDGKTFATDSWEKPKDSKLRGSGRTCIIENGNILEKGGVGFSHVSGDHLPPAATQNRPEIAGRTMRQTKNCDKPLTNHNHYGRVRYGDAE